MLEVNFCEYYCGTLTEEQIAVLEHKVKTGKFIGVARCLAGMAFMPAFEAYQGAWNVIDRLGYSQLAASDGKRLYDEKEFIVTSYYTDRIRQRQSISHSMLLVS